MIVRRQNNAVFDFPTADKKRWYGTVLVRNEGKEMVLDLGPTAGDRPGSEYLIVGTLSGDCFRGRNTGYGEAASAEWRKMEDHYEGVWNQDVKYPFSFSLATGLPCSLEWNGPYDFEEISPVHSNSGVYLWAIPFRGGYLVYYVGESVGFKRRFKQEAGLYRKGGLAIPNIDLYKVGRRCGLDNFYIYQPVRVKLPRPDFSYEKLRDHIEGFLSHTKIFLAVANVGKPDLQVLEKATIWKVWEAGEVCHFICDEACEYGCRPDISLGHRAADKAIRIWGLTDPAPSGSC